LYETKYELGKRLNDYKLDTSDRIMWDLAKIWLWGLFPWYSHSSHPVPVSVKWDMHPSANLCSLEKSTSYIWGRDHGGPEIILKKKKKDTFKMCVAVLRGYKMQALLSQVHEFKASLGHTAKAHLNNTVGRDKLNLYNNKPNIQRGGWVGKIQIFQQEWREYFSFFFV
jgi:hypothetical protein